MISYDTCKIPWVYLKVVCVVKEKKILCCVFLLPWCWVVSNFYIKREGVLKTNSHKLLESVAPSHPCSFVTMGRNPQWCTSVARRIRHTEPDKWEHIVEIMFTSSIYVISLAVILCHLSASKASGETPEQADLPNFPHRSDAVYFVVAAVGGARAWSRILGRTLIDMGPPFSSPQGPPLRPIYVDLPQNGR